VSAADLDWATLNAMLAEARADGAAQERKAILRHLTGDVSARAYRQMGYGVLTFGDGAVGVLRCSSKTRRLVDTLLSLAQQDIERGAHLGGQR